MVRLCFIFSRGFNAFAEKPLERQTKLIYKIDYRLMLTMWESIF